MYKSFTEFALHLLDLPARCQDGGDGSWMALSPSNAPASRAGHAMVPSSTVNGFYVMNGLSSTSSAYDQVFLYTEVGGGWTEKLWSLQIFKD